MKLEHLAPYLPYKLKMKSPHGFRPNGKESTGVSGIVFLTGDLYADIENNTFKGEKFIPILRPLSDLTKEIEHNGEKFVPMKKLKTGGTNGNSVYTAEDWNGTNYVCFDNENHELRFSQKTGFDRRYNCESRQIYAYDLFQKLFEWHFDVFGLIEKGEAIDINTL